jgi:magnesium chelatase family protein
MLASIPSAVLFGAQGHGVTVEVHVGKGLPAFHLVGLPDESIRESRDRVRAAVSSSDFEWPDTKITVNLAPSPRRKTGSGLDLAIAIGVLVASDQLPASAVENLAFIGELGLDGSIRSVPGVAPMVGALGTTDVVVALDNDREARVAALGKVRLAERLDRLVSALTGDAPWPDPSPPSRDEHPEPTPDLADVHGQPLARRALELAAAGGHHVLFVGPPGSGKTMLASRLAGLLPSLDRESALESTMVHSAAGERLPIGGLLTRPPFRAPHHTSSMVSLVGGGSHNLRPGEISLAHGAIT